MFLSSFLVLGALLPSAVRGVTVYGQIPIGITSAADPTATRPAAYNDTTLTPPPIPNPPIGTRFTLALQATSAGVYPLSIPLKGTFYGFSVEMSVINQLFGKNSAHISPIFLNLMANIVARAGAVHVRTGGNTQEYAFFVNELPFGAAIAKQKADTNNPTETPAVIYTIDYFYLLSNISSLVNVKWYLGIPFNETAPFRLDIVHHGEAILGENLLGLQAANEPDLYADHKQRPETYSPFDYFGEFGDLVAVLAADDKVPVKNNLIGPSVATGDWTPEMVWDTGFLQAYSSNLMALSVEHYPDNNCFAAFGVGQPKDYQQEFATFLNHTAGQELVRPYLNTSRIAVAAGKPLLMFETNTASCGGFPGISDSFGGALWAIDYGLQMGYSNFSTALLHVGGQNVFYNPFTAPPTNESAFFDWTIGATYYAVLIVAEVLGKTNTSQLLDLQGNNANIFTPQYAVYENGKIAKVALFNYVTDPSGASDYIATITFTGGTVPGSVRVKYFLSDSVSTKDNMTWAGQTFGKMKAVDGRLQGTLDVRTIACDTGANTCLIPVPAPGFALVFLSDAAWDGVGDPQPATYSTSAYTKTQNTARIDPTALAASNGNSGKLWDSVTGSTSRKSVSAAWRNRAAHVGVLLGAGTLVATVASLV
ncbi:glycoside hydrolase family 79 protein [Mycena belliarum]|uniref:Glycoside hydrolase family 79 protein n=1 Tax=Mycena belliarum TaxID=1033014 RepID=A0AAD6U7X9_9AGAR|nr:glycoside hydrolase family 79 protein [Mycena belliae]